MPQPNWQAFNQGLGGIATAFAERGKQQQDLKQSLQMYQFKQKALEKATADFATHKDPMKFWSAIQQINMLTGLSGGAGGQAGGGALSMPSGMFQQPYAPQTGFDVPEGFEITGYDQQGQPMIRRIKKTKEEGEFLTRKPLRGVGKFSIKRALPSFANFNENTKKVVSNITTKEDLQELLANRAGYEAAGVNVQAIINYYKK